jgi:hypothetical protein
MFRQIPLICRSALSSNKSFEEEEENGKDDSSSKKLKNQ